MVVCVFCQKSSCAIRFLLASCCQLLIVGHLNTREANTSSHALLEQRSIGTFCGSNNIPQAWNASCPTKARLEREASESDWNGHDSNCRSGSIGPEESCCGRSYGRFPSGRRSFLQLGSIMQRPSVNRSSNKSVGDGHQRLDTLGIMLQQPGAMLDPDGQDITYESHRVGHRDRPHHLHGHNDTSHLLHRVKSHIWKSVRQLEDHITLLRLGEHVEKRMPTVMSAGGIAVFLVALGCVIACMLYAVRHVHMLDSDDVSRSDSRSRIQPSQRSDRQGLDQNKQSRFPHIYGSFYPRLPSEQGFARPATAQRPVPSNSPSPISRLQTPPQDSIDPCAGGAPSLMGPQHLCPGLVVPRGNECLLAVPTLAAVGVPPRSSASFNVKDLNGKAVIYCEVAQPDWTGASRAPIVSLKAAADGDQGSGSTLLAYCTVRQDSTSRRSVYVYDSNNELFAQVTKSPFKPCYVLTSGKTGLHLVFDGNFDEHGVSVVNEQREQLADTEPCQLPFDPVGNYYKLRVVSSVDVGIMLCGLLSIDHMEGR